MNAIRGMLRLSLRGYRTNRGRISARESKPQRVIQMTQPGMPVQDIFAELEDPDDLDEYESDFKNVADYDRMHEREMEIKKEKLKSQIVKRKYFKTEEPSMLTWGEKEQIRFLHSQDPEEWPPEKLSDSFPVSRDGVLKILRSKWSPKSAQVVQRYEKSVQENWALFKAGKLRMDPQFEAHLEKFKDRKITTTDPETIVKKMLKPKPVFRNPRSTLFSNIIRSYQNEHPPSGNDDDDEDELPEKKGPKGKSFKEVISDDSRSQDSQQLAVVRRTRKLATEQSISNNQALTFNEFLQNHADSRVRENRFTPVDRVIVDELKEQTTEAYKTKSLVLESASAVGTWKREDGAAKRDTKPAETETLVLEKEEIAAAPMAPETRKKELDVAKAPGDKSIDPEIASNLEGSLETGIIARERTEAAMQDVYPDTIRISRKRYRRGVIYRVQDRYYDADGELLYRVPGLKT